MSSTIIILAIAVVVLIWLISVYNRIAILRQRTDEAWSDIDVQLKRRHDLIPNLIETVKGYAKHEKEVFEQVTAARTAAISAKSVAEQGQAENMLTQALKSVFAVAEAYPDLKASDNFRELQTELSNTEDKIMASRRFYNGNVRDLNTLIQIFPNSLVAGLLGAKARSFFEVDSPAERENVTVSFADGDKTEDKA